MTEGREGKEGKDAGNRLYLSAMGLIRRSADTDDPDMMMAHIQLYRWMLRKKVHASLAEEKLGILIREHGSVEAAKAVVDAMRGEEDGDPTLFNEAKV